MDLPPPGAAKLHPALWGMYASEGAWIPFPWLKWLCEEIIGFLKGPERFLAVSAPPGHGKSELLSKYLPTWFLGFYPGARVIQASYAASLTLEWAKISKELLALHGNEVFGVEVNQRASSEAWDVFRWHEEERRSKRSGYLRAVGRGGPVTGKRAELLILDDIIKDDKEAQSAAIREAAWNWFVKVALTRLTKTGKALVVMTRWHHDDLIGRLEDRKARGLDKDGWRIIRLPAIAEAGDPMGRAPGEPLCPELFPLDELLRVKARDGRAWEALYQGRPTPLGGAIFKRETFRYAKVYGGHVACDDGRPVPLEDLARFSVADLAVSERDHADFSAFWECGVHRQTGRLFLLNLVRERMSGPEILATFHRLSHEGTRVVFVERTAYALHLCQVAASQGVPVRELVADRDKVARAQPAVAAFEAGRVWFREGADWIPTVESELLQFPASSHDDIADVTSYAVRVANSLSANERRPMRAKGAGPRGDGWQIGRGGETEWRVGR